MTRSSTRRPSVAAPTKERIVEAAVRAYLKLGVSQTKTKDIALEAKIDQPLINYYYPEADTLFLDVVRNVWAHLREFTVQHAFRNPDDPKATLVGYIWAPFDWAVKNRGLFSIWVYFYHMASDRDAFTQLSTSIRHGGRDRISLILYSAIEKGIFEVPKGTSVAEVSILIQGLITGNTIMAGTENPPQFKTFAKITEKTILEMLSRK